MEQVPDDLVGFDLQFAVQIGGEPANCESDHHMTGPSSGHPEKIDSRVMAVAGMEHEAQLPTLLQEAEVLAPFVAGQ